MWSSLVRWEKKPMLCENLQCTDDLNENRYVGLTASYTSFSMALSRRLSLENIYGALR